MFLIELMVISYFMTAAIFFFGFMAHAVLSKLILKEWPPITDLWSIVWVYVMGPLLWPLFLYVSLTYENKSDND